MFDPDHEPAPADAPLVRVIPFGMEATVSYGGGTARGPAAILKAAPQVELFDEELWAEPVRAFRTQVLEEPSVPGRAEEALRMLDGLVEDALAAGAFPLVLGGEHALTAGAIRPLVRRHPDLAILHVDAHADLRDGYEGEPYSHAAALRRCLDQPGHEGVRLVSVGIRNISRGEVPFLEANRDRVSVSWAKDRASWRVDEIVEPLRGRPTYVTIDVDGFDGAVMPATGTPEPGGLAWDDVTGLLRAAAAATRFVGADIVELAPHPALHACDFLCAKLAYKLLAYRFAPESRWVRQEG